LPGRGVLFFTLLLTWQRTAAATEQQADGSSPAPPPRASPPADLTYLPELRALAHARRLSEAREWRTLMHYRPTQFGGWRSEADGLGFFMSGESGKRDPAAELDATLAVFFQPASTRDAWTEEGQHPQCVFPARWAWFKRALGIDARRLPDQPCPLYENWRRGIAAEAATLIYATAYLNSPASMYGHTFLRLSRATGEGNPLLDYAVNFAADIDTENGLVYAVRGVTGGFRGRFYVVPYYMKVQEYSNIDSRDLWEYELTLSREQVDRLVMHTWETRSTHFNYFFFTRNCSYQLLTLLEVADPSLHLTDGFGLRVIPSDTIRVVLEQPGLVRGVRPRPSLLSVMTRRKAVLNSPEIRAAELWAAASPGGPAPPKLDLPRERQALIIDAAYDYARYKEGFHAEPSDAFKKRERRMLLARGRLGVPPQEVVTKPGIDAPERGHATLRLGLGGGTSDQSGSFETLSVRGAIHDYLDPPSGYPEDSQLEMGHVRLRFDNDARRLRLDRIDAVNIISAAPLDRWAHSVSWRVWAGVDNAREIGCERPGSDRAGWRCLYGGVITGGGFAARLGADQRALLFALFETDVGAGPAFAVGHDFRIGAGGESGLIGQIGDHWRFQLGGRYIVYLLGARTSGIKARVAQSVSLTRAVELRFAADVAGDYAQLTSEVFGYL
jgi:hypothetical protein